MGCMCRGRIPRYSLPMAPTNHNISLAFINIVIIILILYWFYRVGQPHYYLFPMNQIQLRHSKAEIVEDLKKEWGKIGSLWLDESDPWIEPDGALQLTHAHFKRHAVKMPDGSLKIPTRVPHPGKKNILMQIREISGEGMNSGTPAPAPQEESIDGEKLEVTYRIGCFKDGFRLRALDSSENVLNEVALPPPVDGRSYMIIDFDGEEYFPQEGNMLNLMLCSKYMADNLPKPVLPKKSATTTAGNLGHPPPTLPPKKLPTMDSDSDVEGSAAEAETSPKFGLKTGCIHLQISWIVVKQLLKLIGAVKGAAWCLHSVIVM